MLTELKLGNFIHFKEIQTFTFEKGLNILLGTNHTGKTSVFEAIRRCMSVSLNGGLSNPHDTKKISYAVCKFEKDDCTVFSSIIRIEIFDEVVTVKVAQCSKNGTIEKAIDIIGPVERDLVNDELEAEEFGFNFEKCNTAEDENELKHAVTEYLEAHVGRYRVKDFFSNPPKEKKETKCEKLLKEHVDEEAVIIFPFRSFSQYQWTKSKRDMKDLSGDILDEITMKKEIVYWYLKADKEVISEETRSIEQKYFELITGNSGFRFDLVEGKRVGVRNEYFVGSNPDTENLLKIPEGIYEAKSASIILAVPQFQTICLDDAERGMHPQMVERLRDLVLQDINDKVVLVITHHPAFLAPWNISRTVFFQRHLDDTGYNFAVKPLGKYTKEFGGKGPQIITSGQFPSLFFAERICWIEGKTEYLFMTALKYEFVRKDSSVLKEYCTEGEDQRKRFRDFLSTLHIVSMDGEAGKVFFRTISSTLQLAHFFILDFDALIENIRQSEGEKNKSQTEGKVEMSYHEMASKFCEAFGIDSAQVHDIKTMDDVVNELQKFGIFFWKLMEESNLSSGAIENAVDRMCKKDSDLSKFLEERKIKLTWKKKKQRKKLSKLFKDKEIKNEHITDVVKELLIRSKNDNSSDFYRLVSFLKQMCEDAKSTRSAEGDNCESKAKKRKLTETTKQDAELLYKRT